jgi:hypothetical protein
MQRLEDGHVCQTISDAEQCRELLYRIGKSRLFTSCHALRAFLLYVGEHAIDGKLGAIKEQQIGSRVFGRKPDYDPAQDNIVRVRARELRQRLSEYFAGEGRDETLVISIPKGHYIPVFQPRNSGACPESSPPALQAGKNDQNHTNGHHTTHPRQEEESTRLQAVSRRIPRFHVLGPLTVTVVAVLLGIMLWSKQRPQAVSEQPQADATRCLWSQLFPPGGQELTVVFADAGFALWQDVTNRNLDLGDYLNRRWYAEGAAGDLKMREMAIRRFTSPADLDLAVRIAGIARSYNGRVKARFARNIDVHEVRSGNLVLLGSRRSNPWVELFEPRLNFVLEFDRNGHGPAFRNRSPKKGEPKIVALDSRLSVEGPESRLIKSYAVAALLPGPTEHSNVLIIEGLSMEGTEAAGEFVTNPRRFSTFLRMIGQKADKPIKPFEVLLGLTAIAGGYSDPEVVAYRYPIY